MALSIGQTLQNRYTIIRLLGQGGMGAVYLAQDHRLNVQCAVKETFYTDAGALSQFQREAQLLATLRHPHLPRVSDYFDEKSNYYLVMDYIEGLSSEELVQRHGPISEQQAIRWGEQLLSALAYLHGHQPPIIHRDVKPANVKITPEGIAMLVDFGIAKEYIPGAKTTTSAKAVSPGFSPPEQYMLHGRTDARTDLYALGATLYYLLTASVPPESLQLAMGKPITPVQHLNPQVSTAMGVWLEKAMQVAPEKRWQTAEEMLYALRQVVAVQPAWPRPIAATASSQPVSASAAPPLYVSPPLPQRQARPVGRAGGSSLIWWIAGGGMIALIIVMALVGVIFWQGERLGGGRGGASPVPTRRLLATETSAPIGATATPEAIVIPATATLAPTVTPEAVITPAATVVPTLTPASPTITPTAPRPPRPTATPVTCSNGKVWNGSECVCPPGTIWSDRDQWCASIETEPPPTQPPPPPPPTESPPTQPTPPKP